MAWWIKPLEIANGFGFPTGRWRLTATSDEDGGGPHGLCKCANGHETADEAAACPEAVEKKEQYG